MRGGAGSLTDHVQEREGGLRSRATLLDCLEKLRLDVEPVFNVAHMVDDESIQFSRESELARAESTVHFGDAPNVIIDEMPQTRRTGSAMMRTHPLKVMKESRARTATTRRCSTEPFQPVRTRRNKRCASSFNESSAGWVDGWVRGQGWMWGGSQRFAQGGTTSLTR